MTQSLGFEPAEPYAIETVHRPKWFFAQNGGAETNVIFVMLALVLASGGYGSLSLDDVIGLRRYLRPLHGWLTVLGGTAAAIAVLSQRKKVQSPA
jgi:hypothetical protein